MSLIDPYLRREMLLDQASGQHARGTPYSIDKYGLSYPLADRNQKEMRLLTGFKGRGDYKSFLKYAARGIGGLAGGALGLQRGGLAGAGAGAQSGWDLGAAFSRWAGWGKYRRNRRRRRGIRGRGAYGGDAGGNQIMEGSVQTPLTVNASDDLSGDIYFSHREFVGNVQALVPSSGLSVFNVTSYPINVGLSQTFPWLSQVAENFTLYDLEGCIFEYKPTSGELGSTSNQLGKVIMGTQYDPDSSAFTSAIEMENYDYVTSCKPSEHMLHGVETAPKQRSTQMLYVRIGPTTKDKVFTDIGTFQIATEGIPVAGTTGTYQNIGELWVTYKVKLSRAKIISTLGGNIPSDYFYAHMNTSSTGLFHDTTSVVNSTTGLSGVYVPTTTDYAAPKLTNNIGCTIQSTNQATATVRFPPAIIGGTYKITWTMGTSTLNAIPLAIASLSNCTLVTTLNYLGTNSIYYAPEAGAGPPSLKHLQYFYITVTAPGNSIASFVMGWNANQTLAVDHFLSIEQVNPYCVTSSTLP